MAVVRCITMQKNEVELLVPWLEYYGALFGLDQLEVIDNGSDEPSVLETLEKYEALGVIVHRQFNSFSDFQNKGTIIKAIIEQWDREKIYDFALPVDCDDFLVFAGDEISASPEKIHHYLDFLKDQQVTYQLNRVLLNVPYDPGFFLVQEVHKSLFRSKTIVNLDSGFHLPVTIYPVAVTVELGFVHLHNRKFEKVISSAKEKMKGRVNVFDQKALDSYRGPGEHLKTYFLIDEENYRNRYIKLPCVYVPAIVEKFKELGVGIEEIFGAEAKFIEPVENDFGFAVRFAEPGCDAYRLDTFDAGYYREVNPDVYKSDYWPLYHFTENGFREGRGGNEFQAPRRWIRATSR